MDTYVSSLLGIYRVLRSIRANTNADRLDVTHPRVTPGIVSRLCQGDAQRTPVACDPTGAAFILRAVLLSLRPDELAARLESPARARVVTRALARGEDAWQSPAIFAGIRRRVADTTRQTVYELTDTVRAPDGTTKLLITLAEQRRIEAVIIPSERRSTLCVSSQVGCKRGCSFCLTGAMGLLADLSADEIVLQYWLARREGHAIRNIVFMGMGEPLDNFEAVRRAISVLTHPRAFAVAPKHVTVSTVGPSPEAVLELAALPTRVAWSLHAADNELRKSLVKTQRHDVVELKEAFAAVCARKRQQLFVEITLINGVNDHVAQAAEVAQLFSDFPTEVRVNLIPMNPIGTALGASQPETVTRFANELRSAGLFTTIRQTRGDEQLAACGQLATAVTRRLRVM